MLDYFSNLILKLYIQIGGDYEKSLIVASILLAGSSLVAADGYFVGLDLGNTDIDYSAKASAPSINYYNSEEGSDDGGSQTIRFGKYINSNNRVSVIYQNINADSGDAGFYGASYDYLFGDEQLKPFLGATIGNGFADISSKNINVDIDGLVYGLQAGVNYELNKNVSIEMGYRYLDADLKWKETISVSNVDVNFNIQYDKVKNWYIGLNYKF